MAPHTGVPDPIANRIPVAATSGGLTSAEATVRLQRDGANEVPEHRVHPLARFARKFWGLSAWMLELIAALSFILHKHADLWIVLALLFVNAILGVVQEQRASTALSELRHRLQVTTRVRRDGVWASLAARELVIDDVIRVRGGDIVPADARLVDGELAVDQSALTGESQEMPKRPGDVVYSGSVVRSGEATANVMATGVRTYFGRTTELVQRARPKLHIDEVTSRLVKWLFVIVGVPVATALALSLVRGLPLLDILPLSLVLLLSAVPVALPVMFTVTTAVGSMELARRGLLITRLAAVEDAANMDVLCADKTGTLTWNRLALTGVLAQPGFSEEDVITSGALASNEANQDPLDLAILSAARARGLVPKDAIATEFVPFSPLTRRTEAVVKTNGRTFRVVKGALHAVAEAAGLDAAATRALETGADEAVRGGARVLAVARGENGSSLQLLGMLLLRDAPRPDSRQLIHELQSLGVHVKMLTGDALPVARVVASELGLGEPMAASRLRDAMRGGASTVSTLAAESDGFAEVFPEDKFAIVQALQASGHVVGMTGDGINDAPALRQAEVGIAVSGATDVAKSAGSVVLTTDGLAGIVDLVKTGRMIYQRLLTWIINKVSRTILKAGFVVVAFLVSGRIVVSALPMLLLVFMTDFVKIALATDRARPSARPESWSIGPLVTIAAILGMLMTGEALGLLAFGWHRFHLEGGRLETFSFLTLLYFALFSIVSIRERRAFWASRPAALLTAGLAADAALGIVIGRLGLAEMAPLPWNEIVLIIGCGGLCSLVVNDLVKSSLIKWRVAEYRPAQPT